MSTTGYFTVENIVIDGYFEKDIDGKMMHTDAFSNIYEKMIYIVLTRHANNNNGIAYPSLTTIAREAICGVSTVKRCIKSLEEKGYITKTTRPKLNGDHDSNLYILKKISSICKGIILPQSQENAGKSIEDHKEEQNKNNYKDHDNSNSYANTSVAVLDVDIFEKLFKKINVSYTTKNRLSVKALLKKMTIKQVQDYLLETYNNIKISPGVLDIAALFSAKIARQERQMTAAARKAISEREREIERQKQLERRIQCVDPITVYNALPPQKKLEVEKKALDIFLEQSTADEKLMLKMREKNPMMYFNTIKIQLGMVLRI